MRAPKCLRHLPDSPRQTRCGQEMRAVQQNVCLFLAGQRPEKCTNLFRTQVICNLVCTHCAQWCPLLVCMRMVRALPIHVRQACHWQNTRKRRTKKIRQPVAGWRMKGGADAWHPHSATEKIRTRGGCPVPAMWSLCLPRRSHRPGSRCRRVRPGLCPS